MPDGVLAARGLGHVWPDGARAFGDLSFEVAAGEKVALLGPNGAGKSTLLRLLAGRLAATEGEIRLAAGAPAYLPQQAELDPEMTPRETLGLIAALLALPDRARRVERVTGLFGLVPHLDKKVADLSGGSQRRLDLALFFLEEKPLLLLDEPAAGLDAAAEQALFAALEERAARGAAILLSGHDLGQLARFARRALYFESGRPVAEGAPEDFAGLVGPGGPGPGAGPGRGGGPGQGRGGGRRF